MILIVSYDLKSARDYTAFYNALRSQGTWWHYLASTWLISTGKSPEEVANAVRPQMDLQDFLLVADPGPRYQGYLPPQAWDWINTQRKLEVERVAGLQALAGALSGLGVAGTGALDSPSKPTGTLDLPKSLFGPLRGKLSDLK